MRGRRGERTAREQLTALIRSVRRRWRTRILLRGGSIVLAAALAAVALSVWGLEAARFSPGAVLTFRILSWGIVLGLLAWLVIRPLIRRVSDEQVALYLEEHEPSLKASVLGAIEAGRSGELDPGLLQRVVLRAVQEARRVEDGRRIDQSGIYRASGAFTVLAVGAVALLLFGPLGFRQGARALLPTEDAAAVNPYSILVTPGDLTVAKGSDQYVQAELVGFASEEVALMTRTDGEEIFQRITMIPAAAEGDPGYEVLLVGLEESLEYYVESDGIRSGTHRIDVVELPYVDRMDHEYRYPSYTGLPVRNVEGAGDVAALRGTQVVLTIQPTLGTPAGRLLVAGEEPVELEVQADGTLTGSFTVRERGFYSIELALADGRMVAASPEYTIDLLADQPPSLSITRPGRDTPASPIEELYLEAEADDDYGIDELLLVYSVNGEPEDTVAIYSGSGRPLTQVTAGHTLYLEDFEVEPGDVVSYYAVTRDVRQGPGEEVVSDIYFVNVQPFRRDFRQAEQQGGGGGGGGGGAEEPALSELQKQVIAATFNLVRDRERYEDDDFSESVAAVSLAQGRVREQVATLAQRMTNRGLASAEDRFREIAEMLPQALEAMDSAQARLDARTPRDALGPEQEALRVIQRAEETYEAYVGQQQGGGGGGGGGADADDLADLFELELDQLQNQYETVQRGEREQANEEVDQLLEKLNELARRQQQEAERQRARGQQGSASAGGGSSARSQRELADEAEEAARQLQRLSRETGDPQLAETAQQLQQAADAMRRAAANAGNSGAAEAGRALDRIQDAQRRLQQDRETRLDQDTQEALERVRGLQERQQEIQDRLAELPSDPSARADEIRSMSEEKSDMAREVGELERDLNRLSQEARQRDEATARALGEAVNEIDESKLVQKLQYSRGVLEQRDPEYARVFEETIEADLERLEQAVQGASEAAAEMQGQAGLEESLDEARSLLDRVESLDRRLSDRAQEGAESGQGSPQEGQQTGEGREGQEGQQGEGQQGQQGGQGEQGQQSGQGQQGQQGAQGQQGQQGQAGQQGNGGGQGDQARQGAEGGGQAGDAQGGAPRTQEGLPGGGATRGNPTGPGGPLTDEEIRQFQREFQERAQDATALRDQLREQGQDVSDLDRALDAIRALQDREAYEDLPQISILQQTIRESLGRLEFGLRRQVQGDEAPAALSGSEAIPERFRGLVEEYYRRLAREGGGN